MRFNIHLSIALKRMYFGEILYRLLKKPDEKIFKDIGCLHFAEIEGYKIDYTYDVNNDTNYTIQTNGFKKEIKNPYQMTYKDYKKATKELDELDELARKIYRIEEHRQQFKNMEEK